MLGKSNIIPTKKDKVKMEARVGIYICHCGSNISDIVDVNQVVQFAQNLDSISVVRDYRLLCSEPGQELIKKDIKEKILSHVVIASCSPAMHEITFRRVCQEAGINPYLMQIANIREQCSWVTDNKSDATEKSKALVRAAVKRVLYHQPLKYKKIPINPDTLIVGGGIAGIQAALAIADSQHKVYLVEKSPSIGGHMIQLDKTFPTLDCAACIISPKMALVGSHPFINLLTYTEVENISGYIGNFKVSIRSKAKYVEESKCNGCGACFEVCPIELPSEFEQGLSMRKAIYTPFPQAVPNIPVIDMKYCPYISQGTCRACEKLCESEVGAKAINFFQTDKINEIEVGNIILATGFDLFDPSRIYEYGYKRLDNVISSLDFERMVNSAGPTGGDIVLKDGSVPRSVAIVHCVGSRDVNYNDYCSGICCMEALKFTHIIKNKINAEVYQMYIDMRCVRKRFEEFYEQILEEGAILVRGRPGEITNVTENSEEKGKLIIIVEDTLIHRRRRIPVDLVVLNCAIEPQSDAQKVARIFNINVGNDGFFLEKHPKLYPVSTMTDGIFIAGCCQGPKDIPDTVDQASAAAAQVLTALSKGNVEIEPTTIIIDKSTCSGCQTCVKVCPYNAIYVNLKEQNCGVNEALCRGCGICVAECRNSSIVLNHCTDQQLIAEMEGILGS